MTTELTRSISFFALPDPADPSVMTFWRRERRGRGRDGGGYLNAWPGRVTYGPVIPPDQEANPLNWATLVTWPWIERRDAALAADPAGCAARFTVLTGRCCACGKPTDTEGICTKCQPKVPAETVRLILEVVSSRQEK